MTSRSKSRHLEHAIEIEAPIARVWDVLTDVEQYPTWNPFVTAIEGVRGAPDAGTVMTLVVKWHDGGGARPTEIVRAFEPPTRGDDGVMRARWVYEYLGFWDRVGAVHGSRLQRLEQRDGGPTIYTSEEDFSGPLLAVVPVAKVQVGFEAQAKALKLEAEPRGMS